ncbi:hypothetical protein [Catenulispora subtropica]|uniref:Transposase (putative) YhgA-like domain-containing protein n=1 Tax=Catenulispora subtropica TaxID=450798 RepID=A0ABP5C3N0_9ACTN
MVGSSHEAMHRIFHHDSEMLGRTFRALGLDIPAPDTVAVISGDVTEIHPLERRVDTLLRCETADGAEYLVLVEAQRSCDPDKLYSWMYYLAYLADKYRLPVLLLVVCHDRRVAKWASQPVKRGVGDWAALTMRPLVVGPHNVPPIRDEETARRDVPLAVFSALTHAYDEGVDAILRALASALKSLDDQKQANDLAELTLIGLDDTPARAIWRQIMAIDLSFYRSSLSRELIAEGRLEGRAEGRLEGRAEGRIEGRVEGRVQGLAEGRDEGRREGRIDSRVEMLLRFVITRGIALSAEQRERIEGCADLRQLDIWLDRVLIATTAAEVFDAD